MPTCATRNVAPAEGVTVCEYTGVIGVAQSQLTGLTAKDRTFPG